MHRDPELPNGFQDADFDQRDLEAAGNRYYRKMKRSEQLRESGDLMASALACPHSWSYPLKSIAATNAKDRRSGEAGVRCLNCFSVLSGQPWSDHHIVHPCETK